jgi:small-conductance mechanosensitive channel
MPDFSDTPAWVEVALRVGLIVIAALAGYLAIRTAVDVSVKHIMERRAKETGQEGVPPAELERRVQTVGLLIVRVGGGLIAVIAALMMLDLFGIDIGPALAGLGVAGIAVGFGAQTLVRDWLAGIFIVLENQYNAGDVVRIAGVEGTVEDFSLRRTTLRDLDGTVHAVPNGQIIVASNMTRLWSRVNLDISVTYDTDLDRATAIIDRIGEELLADETWGPRLLEAPSVVRVAGLGDSAVALKILGRVQAAQQWAVTGELRKRILAEFGRAGIEIAVRRRVVVSGQVGDAASGDADADAEAAAADD